VFDELGFMSLVFRVYTCTSLNHKHSAFFGLVGWGKGEYLAPFFAWALDFCVP
jgi:hypothetical protein